MSSGEAGGFYRNGAESKGIGLWFLVFVLFASLYVATSQRDISWQDSGEYQWRVLNGVWYETEVGHGATTHPLYIVLGMAATSLVPASPIFALNAFSGVGMAVALANLSVVVLLLTGRVWVAIAAALMVGGYAHGVVALDDCGGLHLVCCGACRPELWLLVLLLRRPGLEICGRSGVRERVGVRVPQFRDPGVPGLCRLRSDVDL